MSKLKKNRKWISGYYENTLNCSDCKTECKWNHSYCSNCGTKFDNSQEAIALREIATWRKKGG